MDLDKFLKEKLNDIDRGKNICNKQSNINAPKLKLPTQSQTKTNITRPTNINNRQLMERLQKQNQKKHIIKRDEHIIKKNNGKIVISNSQG
jgi:hypothetical protein